jgi:hypothetical protein
MSATENASEMIKIYRPIITARQGQITGEIMEIIGGPKPKGWSRSYGPRGIRGKVV